MSTNDGTIDITDLVESMRSSFVLAAKNYLYAMILTAPGIGPVALWFAKTFAGAALDWLLNRLTNWSVMQAFFINTAIRKASQAADYKDAVDAKKKLPDTATDAEYEKAEQHEINMFTNFVRLTN